MDAVSNEPAGRIAEKLARSSSIEGNPERGEVSEALKRARIGYWCNGIGATIGNWWLRAVPVC